MIIKPMIRSNICINAHPAGCAANVDRWISFVQSKKAEFSSAYDNQGPKNVLVLGCSTGYGLAGRIAAAFGWNSATVGVSFEKEGSEKKGGTPGWYNNIAFDHRSKEAGIPSATFNVDAFADASKQLIIDHAKKAGIVFDLVLYSLASPVRTDPVDGVMYRSVIKPVNTDYAGTTLDPFTLKLYESTAQAASEEEIYNTKKVMGGEDWLLWIKALASAGILASGCKTVALSYIGPELSQAIYRNGTIGLAKVHLEQTVPQLDSLLSSIKGKSFVSVNKGLVTRSSAVIPIIPLYLAILYKIMKKRGTHEDCAGQMERLLRARLYTGGSVPVDEAGRIRIDDLEMDPQVQKEVLADMAVVTEENVRDYADIDGYIHDFMQANGFAVPGVDYEKDTERFDTV